MFHIKCLILINRKLREIYKIENGEPSVFYLSVNKLIFKFVCHHHYKKWPPTSILLIVIYFLCFFILFLCIALFIILTDLTHYYDKILNYASFSTCQINFSTYHTTEKNRSDQWSLCYATQINVLMSKFR